MVMTLTWPSFCAALTNADIPPPAVADVTVAQFTFLVAAFAPPLTIETPASTVLTSPEATPPFIFFVDTRRPPKCECTGLVTRDESKLRELAECDARRKKWDVFSVFLGKFRLWGATS